MKYLLDKGADPTQRDRFGNTALDEARREGHQEIEEILNNYDRAPQVFEFLFLSSFLFIWFVSLFLTLAFLFLPEARKGKTS